MFCDSLINCMYLKKSSPALCGELLEEILVTNLKRLHFKAARLGSKTKNKFDSKTDIIVALNKDSQSIPFSVKSGVGSRIKIKNGLSKQYRKLLNTRVITFDKNFIEATKKELSSKLYILHVKKIGINFVLQLKKINITSASNIKKTGSRYILFDNRNNKIITFDLKNNVINANSCAFDIIDSLQLGRDNSIDKEAKGESLLINSIIASVCLCDIPSLRRIDKLIQDKIKKH